VIKNYIKKRICQHLLFGYVGILNTATSGYSDYVSQRKGDGFEREDAAHTQTV